MRQELIEHLRNEYRAFVERHSRTPREIPDLPFLQHLSEDEQQLRLSKLKEALKREPLWGQIMERRWRDKLSLVERRSDKEE
jgi:hypothetical protein